MLNRPFLETNFSLGAKKMHNGAPMRNQHLFRTLPTPRRPAGRVVRAGDAGGRQGGRRAAGGAHLARRPPLRYANQVEMMGIHPMIKMISTSTGTPNFIQ